MGELHIEETPFDASEFRRDGCDAEDCGCYPHYGHAPSLSGFDVADREKAYTSALTGERRVIPAGTPMFVERAPLPSDEWPANFIEDPDVPGLGTYLCPSCMRGLEDGR